jgi:hypothetical protein
VKAKLIKCELHDFAHQGGAKTTATLGRSNKNTTDIRKIVLTLQHKLDMADDTIAFDCS